MSFTDMPSDSTGVNFSNDIIENDTLNYFNFPYLYLGGGVSIGDINNDGLDDLYFTGNLVPNKLYLNKGNFQFEDISVKAGVAGDQRWYTGSTMADVNNDGFLDIYVGVSQYTDQSANQLFINNKDGTFSEKAQDYGLADQSTSIQSTFFDYDNDGYLDVFVANYPIVPVSMGNQYYHQKMMMNHFEDSGHLYRNNGDQTFTDVTTTAGLQKFGLSLGIIATDFNNDGFKDLYVSNDFNVPDYFYKNNGDGTFSEISKQSTRHTSMFGMGIDSGDLNNDGLIDFLQVDMTAEDYKRSKTNMASMSPETFYEAVDLGFNHQYMQNALQLNNGINSNGIPVFSDISRFASMSNTDWSWGALFADFDNDGFKDVFVSNGVKRDVNNNDINEQYKNQNPFGNSGKKDFRKLPSTPISNYAFQNNGDYTFSKVTTDWLLDKKGFSNGFSYADLDNDGDLDLIINNIDAKASVYRNNANETNNHYVKIKLKGAKNNPFALGTKVFVKTPDANQLQELTLTRGYQSSSSPVLHFGTGKHEIAESITIKWPNGSEEIYQNLKLDTLMQFTQAVSKLGTHTQENNDYKFTDITEAYEVSFKHTEDEYDDFLKEPLLPHRNSRLGPALTVGDVNNDGLDDFFVGNAKGSSAKLYIQNLTGKFSEIPGPWSQESEYEDTNALLFDADNDNDLDLYIVSGGNDPNLQDNLYQDRLFINTSNGFEKTENALPSMPTSGLNVIASDYDSDGDLDLFIGGRLVPGQYPSPAYSYILRNDGGTDLNIKYTNVTQTIAPELQRAGLVTSALWDDFDSDGKIDLIVTGEWMPIRFFKNTGHKFKEVTETLGFNKTRGWWNTIEKVDFDNDGDLDYLVGNLGLNYKYKTSAEAPFDIYANDFDENGSIDIVLSYQKKGTKLPLRGRECSSQQVPAIKQRFETFESFANADLNDIYGENMLNNSLHYRVDTFAHQWIENKGEGSFQLHQLPNAAQFSSINAFLPFKYNNDSITDIMLGGNQYQSEIETPRADASIGLVLSGGTKPKVINTSESGLFVAGETKKIARIRLGKDQKEAFLFARNNDYLKLLTLKK